MKTIKGPAIFLAQFVSNEAPFSSLETICAWASSLGYKGIQIPTWDTRLIDIEKAAESRIYCDEILGKVAEHDLVITELSTHLQGKLLAVHPVYDELLDGFAPEKVHNNPKARQAWAVHQVKCAAIASNQMGLCTLPSFSGSLAWPFFYPFPQLTKGLIEMAFVELAKIWIPILNHCDEHGIDVCYELHPGEDLHDGISYEMFLEKVNNHPRANLLYDPSHFALQQLDYLEHIEIYHERIRAFHVKDAEFVSSGRQGVYGGYQDWLNRAGRFRSPGDGQIDFNRIFSQLSAHEFDGWAVLEWECALKNPIDGAREGAQFIKDHIIHVTERAFDDFTGASSDNTVNRDILGFN